MMRRLAALPALLLLAACGGTPAPAPRPGEDPQVAECREEARQSPQSQDMARRMNFNNPTQMDRIREEQRMAEARVFQDCLRRRGLSRGGGVEPLRRPGAL